MTYKDIKERNERFQKQTIRLVDLFPDGGYLDMSTGLIRGVRLIDKYLIKLVGAKTKDQFDLALHAIEKELDDAVYLLDRIEFKNKELKVKQIEVYLKEGYDLLSIYSMCCDHMIASRINAKSNA